MKKPYQIESRRAVKRWEEMAAQEGAAVQMTLPVAEMLGWLRQGVGELVRQAGSQLMERRLDKLRIGALLIDATPFEGQQMIAALGVSQDGRKTILGIRQGATENATVVGELLSGLAGRGLDFSEPRLYVLDGAKALRAAVSVRRSSAARFTSGATCSATWPTSISPGWRGS